MSKQDSIRENADILELGENASFEEVGTSYRRLLKKYHPDTSEETNEDCKEKIKQITEAYKYLREYFMKYKIPLSENPQTPNNPKEFWNKHFASDPLWGK